MGIMYILATSKELRSENKLDYDMKFVYNLIKFYYLLYILPNFYFYNS